MTGYTNRSQETLDAEYPGNYSNCLMCKLIRVIDGGKKADLIISSALPHPGDGGKNV